MAVKERGLGRGLDSLFGTVRETDAVSRDIRRLGVTQLVPGSHQPRKWFDDAALEELSSSIKAQGIVQPLIVRPRADATPQVYEIVAGERRWRAAKRAGLTEVPVIIAEYSDLEAMTVALVENLQREDLNPLEEAEGLQALRDAHNLSQEELAAKLGKSRPAIANALRLLSLPLPVKQALGKGILSPGHARALLAVAESDAQEELFQRILANGLTVREVEAAAEHWKRTGKLPEPAPRPGARGASRGNGKPRKTEKLKKIQPLLREKVHHDANISGDEERGRIALPYASAAELAFLLGLLGVAPEGDPGGAGEAVPLEEEPLPDSAIRPEGDQPAEKELREGLSWESPGGEPLPDETGGEGDRPDEKGSWESLPWESPGGEDGGDV
jgi:ParB family chromosome partitioning protein